MVRKITYCIILWFVSTSLGHSQSMLAGPVSPLGLDINQSGKPWIDTSNLSSISMIDTNYLSVNFGLGDTVSSTLNCSQFPISVPDSSIITGIIVSITKKRDSLSAGNLIYDSVVQLSLQGSPAGQNKAEQTLWSQNETTTIYGDTNDTWGVNWTLDDFNSMDVGLDIITAYMDNADTSNATAYINQIRIEVYYQPDTTLTPSSPILATENKINYLYPLDAEYSEYEIQAIGNAKIFNKEGLEVRNLTTPAVWDGTDYDGNLLPTGIYYLITNETEVYPIMIVK